jgi:hypothetical protein
MVNEVAVHKMLAAPRRDLRKLAKAYVNARVGRAGMALTARELESRPAGRGQIHTENIAS